MGDALRQELQHDRSLGVGCAKGRSDVWCCWDWCGLETGRNEVLEEFRIIMVVQDCPGCCFDSDFRRGERYWLWGG